MICSQLPAKAATLQAKVTQVDSGNFLVVSNINRPLKIKLKAIEPPEAGQPFSEAARDHLKALVFDKAVAVEYTHLSSGYLEAKVFLNGIDIASQMLRDGVAWYNRSAEYTLSQADRDLYMQCEQAARNEKRGLWQDAAAVAPWQFRRDQEAKLAKLDTQLESPLAAPRQSLRRSPRPTNSGLGSNDLLSSVMGAGLGADGSSVGAISENGTADRWTIFESVPGHFSINIPSNAIEKSSETSDPSGRPIALQLVVGGGPQGFFSLTRLKGPDDDNDDASAIEVVIRNIIAGMNDAATQHYEFDKLLTVKPVRQLKLANYYGRQFSLSSKFASGSARVFTSQRGDAREFFVLMALVPPGGDAAAARFLNSFRIK